MKFDPIAKFLVITGVISIVAGFAWAMGWIQALKLGRLPGDIAVEKENVKFYFPFTSGIVLSIVLSLLAWVFRKP